MHYYKRNIGDYAKKAGRLSMLEHGAYTLLMDAIYDRETFPTLEEALDWAWARDDAEVAAIKFVLSKFFTLDGDRYVQKRIQDELDSYKAKAETNARIAKDREAKRKSKHEPSRNVHEACEEKHEPSPNHKPLTINQEPLTSNQYIYTFDIDYVNANLLKSGRKPVDQKYIDQLQPQFELYYANQPMADNKALVKFVQWIMRNQDQPQKQQSITKTTAQILAEQRMQLDQQQGQVIDVGEPKKPLLIEEVGRA
ncbi:YdaU family protein [Acinetobacter johnsonii]|uniref:YdaU family protein n=1 Tax=Acinetobacter johnsonii TaxID=40214 RepID=UPI00244D07CF|nr:YdaU family protein [Acinetobacter johnsonii]MDH1800478.1 YdaU family protein [Acinetobacter johnsonii]